MRSRDKWIPQVRQSACNLCPGPGWLQPIGLQELGGDCRPCPGTPLVLVAGSQPPVKAAYPDAVKAAVLGNRGTPGFPKPFSEQPPGSDLDAASAPQSPRHSSTSLSLEGGGEVVFYRSHFQFKSTRKLREPQLPPLSLSFFWPLRPPLLLSMWPPCMWQPVRLPLPWCGRDGEGAGEGPRPRVSWRPLLEKGWVALFALCSATVGCHLSPAGIWSQPASGHSSLR